MSKIGLIYEIVCNETGERYVGSTFETTVAKRMVYHRKDRNKKVGCRSQQIILRDDYTYGLLETVTVISRDELRMCERKWYDKLECINKYKPYVTPEETKERGDKYRLNNKEHIAEISKAYLELHKDQKKEYDTAYREKNKEKIVERDRAFYETNRDKLIAKSQAYNASHIEEKKKYDAAFRETNKIRIQLQRKNHREMKKIQSQEPNSS